MRLHRKWLLLLILPAAAAVAFGLKGGDGVRYFAARVEKGEIRDVVEATGTINAVITVQVGSQVSGTIAKLNADFNSRVHSGDVVALIDPALFQGALLQATADLENARANLVAAEANLDKARATLVQAKAEYERTVRLTEEGVSSPQQLDLAKAGYDAANATVGGAAANVIQAKAQVSQKAAAVSVAQTNLNYTVIRSPIDGIVVARNVDVGQTVAASLQAPTIFTIAQDLTKMQVYAKTDESDVGSIQLGRPVAFKVDAFPKDTFQGVVTQVRMNATVVQNVVTYDTIVGFDNPGMKLFPGMTAYVTIPVANAQNVLKVPNAALRYKPPLPLEEIRALYERYGLSRGEGRAASEPGAPADAPAPGDRPKPASREPRSESAVVWKLRSDKTIQPVKISVGITDHTFTEVRGLLAGDLNEGDEVITGSVASKTQGPGGPGVGRR